MPRPLPSAPIALRLVFLAVAAFALPAAAEAPAAPRRDTPPIWTTTPTRIDPAHDLRQRIEPVPVARPDPRALVRGARVAEPGVLLLDGRRHRLFGLAPIDPARLCGEPTGRRWTCGLRARGALVLLVGGRTLRCLTIEPAAEPPVIDCLWQERSLSERLVADGWAELDDAGRADPILAAALSEAQKRTRGLWSSSGPPGIADEP